MLNWFLVAYPRIKTGSGDTIHRKEVIKMADRKKSCECGCSALKPNNPALENKMLKRSTS